MMKYIRLASLVSLVLLLAACNDSNDAPKTEPEKLVPMTLYSGVRYGAIRGPGVLVAGKTARFETLLVKLPPETRELMVRVDGLDNRFERIMDLPVAGESRFAVSEPEGTIAFEVPLPANEAGLRAIVVRVTGRDTTGEDAFTIRTAPLLLTKKNRSIADIPVSSDFFRDIDGRYLWDVSHVTYSETGDMQWAPRPATENLEGEIRYIDYADGDDSRDGKSTTTAWKHHPWDAAFTGKDGRLGDTFVFKRGVTYYGSFVADQSDRTDRSDLPIRLTSSETFGEGEAVIHNSDPTPLAWEKTDKPNIFSAPFKNSRSPQPYVKLFFNRGGGKIEPLVVARFPNWRWSDPHDPRSEWLTVQHRTTAGNIVTITNERIKELGGEHGKNFRLTARTVLHCDFHDMMAFPYPWHPIAVNTAEGTVTFETARWGVLWGNRFYLSNNLAFLDEAGEYFYDHDAGKLYVYVEKESDLQDLEISTKRYGLTIDEVDNIEISNLTFRLGNDKYPVGPKDELQGKHWLGLHEHPATIRIFGADGVTVKNCKFEYGVNAVTLIMCGHQAYVDRFTVSDCDFRDLGGYSVRAGDSVGVVARAKILRNRSQRVAMTVPHSHSIRLYGGRLGVLAGNIATDIGGIGVDTFWGYGNMREGHFNQSAPLIRGIVTQNRVENPLLMVNDYGCIESWNIGPVYIYNNQAINPVGTWSSSFATRKPEQRGYSTSRFSFAYYLDGGYKCYLFNNTAVGRDNDIHSKDCNASAFQEVLAFENKFFNNTVYKFAAGVRRQMPQPGRNQYRSNIFADISEIVFDLDGWRQHLETNKDDFEGATNIIIDNLIYGVPKNFGTLVFRGKWYETLEEFAAALRERNFTGDTVGRYIEENPFTDAAKDDFRLCEAVGCGARTFVPWGLYECVGEWSFYRPNRTDVTVIPDIAFNFSDEHVDRNMYWNVPRNDLTVVGAKPEDFVTGRTDSIATSALRFDGASVFASASDAEAKSDRTHDYATGAKRLTYTYEGNRRPGLDMQTNNFLIEMVVETKATGQRQSILSKHDGKNGYAVKVESDGSLALELHINGNVATFKGGRELSAPSRIEGAESSLPPFTHWLIEVDRKACLITIYREGENVASIPMEKFLTPSASLANASDFFVGRDAMEAKEFFAGTLDYLRVSRGTLAQAGTDIETLYRWQFDGPAHRDFLGKPRGNTPDAGAFQH